MATSIIKGQPVEQLTITQSSTSYMGADDFARMKAYKKGGMLYFYGNAYMKAGSSVSEVTIGSIAGWNAAEEVMVAAPGYGYPSSTVVWHISKTGTISISSHEIKADWYRFSVSVPAMGG